MVTKGYGITVKDIDDSCPVDLEPYEYAHRKEVIETDALEHQMGMYVLSAFSTVINNFVSHKGKYIDKPLLSELAEEIESSNTYSERREYAAVFEMKQRIKLLKDQGLPPSPM